MEKLIKKIRIQTELEILTGLHIGDSAESIEIGGVDKPVVRRSFDNTPYIPGSSIKGKIRCLLEQIAGASEVGRDNKINDLFGWSNDGIPSKLLVRDAQLTEKSKLKLIENENTDMPFTEIKFENSIGRITGTATNPRQIERVPAGVRFKVEFVINVWDTDQDGKNSLELLKKGIFALEHDYLGGSGSRGYGQVKFHDLDIKEIDLQNITI